ncbi:hypothetical protein KUTeg_020213 [Tegillarca granosa]|uniref:G-protein coupled receptors family 1 profile domain-containing protein n=1 Tax=Tegillarca granosa TaxID=220873 RepID=A0ABQ9EBM6_TEGGR|nr:hypothetical protein KUTeg_020213 [Tegillarca granosa]
MAEMNTTVVNTSSDYALQWTDIFLGVFLFTIVLTTIIGNAFVLIAIFREKRLQTSFNYYIVNLAVTDILVAVTAMAFFTIDNILKYWPFGEFMCGVWIFFDYGMTFVSVFTLLVISVDRIFMIVLWLPPFIVDRMKNSVPRFCKWEPAYNPEFVVVIAVVGHHGSCFILLFCYIRVFYMLRKRSKIKIGNKIAPSRVGVVSAQNQPTTSVTYQPDESEIGDKITADDKNKELLDQSERVWSVENSKKTLRPVANSKVESLQTSLPVKKIEASKASTNSSHQQDSNPNENDSSKYERKEAKVFKTLTYIIIGYILCWVPFHIVFDISAIAPDIVPEKIYIATFWLAYLNSTINPFLVFMIFLWVPPFIMDRIKNSAPRICKWEPAYNPEFVVVIAVVGHHGSCFILLFCYVKVVCVLRKRSKLKIGNKVPYSKRGKLPTTPATNQLDKVHVGDESTTAKGDNQMPDELDSTWSTCNSKHVFRSGAKAQVAPLQSRLQSKLMETSTGSFGPDTKYDKNPNKKYISKYEHEQKEAKVVKTLRYIIVGYIFCWVPFHIVFDISAIAPNIVPEKIYIATFWLTYLNSAINPFLYNFSSSEFKQAFKNILLSCIKR